MKKKLLRILLIVVALVCALTSCSTGDSTPADDPETSHIHLFGEWETTKVATCTTEGRKERYCSCGEKQTATIAIAEHTYVEGVCINCNQDNNEDNNEDNNQNTETNVIETKYASACNLIVSGNYAEAYQLLNEIQEYAPAREKLKNFFYAPTSIKIGSAIYPGPRIEYETLRISYDMCGNIVSVTNMDTFQNYNFTYDSSGNVQSGWSLDFHNIDYRGFRYYVYENGKIKKVYLENESNTIDEYFYDTDGNVSKIVTTYTYNGETESYESVKYTYTYYSDRSIRTMRAERGYTDIKIQYDTDGKIEKIYSGEEEFYLLTYGEFGIQELKSIDNYVRWTYRYDENGNLTEMNYYSGSGGDLTFTYEFSGYQLCYSENAIAKERIGIISSTSIENLLVGDH